MNAVSSVSCHPTAVVASNLPADTVVGAYAVIEEGVKMGAGCVIASHAILRKGTILGDGVKVDSFAVIAGLPQDLKFDPATPSYVKIGSRTVIREGVTIHRSTQKEGSTIIGEDCFLMAQSHVGHDCTVGNRVVMANAALLAGHVQVGDCAFLGGSSGVHQFVRVGESVMLAGMSVATHDIPPYVTAADRNVACGLNLVGIKRRGFSTEVVAEIKRLYKAIIFKDGDLVANAQAAQPLAKTPEGRRFVEFFLAGSRRQFIRSKSKNVVQQ